MEGLHTVLKIREVLPVKKVLYGILGVLSLLSLFIIACAFQPDLADKVSGLLYADRGKPGAEEGQDGVGTDAPDTAKEGNGPGAVNEGNEPGAAKEGSGSGAVNEGNVTGAGTAADGKNGGMPGGAAGADGTVDAASSAPGAGAGAVPAQGNGGGGKTSDEVLGLGGGSSPAGQGNRAGGRTEEAAGRAGTKAPESVAGRGGYVPVQGETEQIDDKEAEKLREQYTYGETGEGLDFDPVFYPYYAMLNDRQKAVYRQIYANTEAVNRIFNPVEEVSQEELKNVFMAVFNDQPALFWLDSAYRGKFDRKGNCVEISLEFNELIDDLDSAKARFREEAESILSGARRLDTDYEVEVYIHNALLDRIQYDLRAPLNQSTYSGLVNGKTVCAGYARSFQHLMMELGIPCYYCTGYAGEAHAWNIVQLGGEYYNADATWDDTDPNTFDFFNKTDEEFNENHRREDLSVNLPACNGTRYANLESSPRQPGQESYRSDARTLADAGFKEEDVLQDIKAYYADCYRQIIANGGSCSFQNVVDSERLWLQCYDAYDSDAYSAGYMDQVFADLGMTGCNVDIEAEPLRDGRFLLHHNIEFQTGQQ